MAKYIDKASLVAEIVRKMNRCKKNLLDLRTRQNKDYYQGKREAYIDILSFLDTLEVKDDMDTIHPIDDVVSNGPISNPLEISRHGNSHNGNNSDLGKAAGNYAFTMSGEDEVLKYYAFKAGAKWQEEQMIDKGCEWLEEHLLDFWSQRITNTDYFIEDFKQAMNK